MNVTLKLGKYQLIEIRRMAAEAGTDVSGIVGGIIAMYLNGKAGWKALEPHLERLAKDVLVAVAAYKIKARLNKIETPAGRRQPLLGGVDIARIRKLKAKGWTYPELALEFGVSVPTVRRATGSLKT